MQWDHGANLGFSQGRADDLYLPVDPAADAPTVEDAMANDDSLWHVIQSVLALHKSEAALHTTAGFDVIQGEGRAFAFARTTGDERLVIAVNPGRNVEHVAVDGLDGDALFAIDSPAFEEGGIMLPPQSFVIAR